MVIYSAGGHAGSHVGWERRYLSRLSGTLIDGAVLVTPTVVDVNYGAPIVAIDPHTGQSGLPTIDSDNLRGGQLATDHLLELGHRRIAMIGGRPDLQSSQLREQGYREALVAAGIRVDDELILVGGYDPDVSAECARQLLTSADPPTAIFGANDVSAIAAIEAAAGLGLRVPGGPVGGRVRQHPRVGALLAPADHGQPAHPADGRARDPAAAAADARATASSPRTSRWPPTWSSAVHPGAVAPAGRPLARPRPGLRRPQALSIVVDNVL